MAELKCVLSDVVPAEWKHTILGWSAQDAKKVEKWFKANGLKGDELFFFSAPSWGCVRVIALSKEGEEVPRFYDVHDCLFWLKQDLKPSGFKSLLAFAKHKLQTARPIDRPILKEVVGLLE